jgi:hypothetical protein
MNDERRAIEALRAGVPNRAAIRLLGTSESEISERFLDDLRRCQQSLINGEQVTGQVIAGRVRRRQVASARLSPGTCAQRQLYSQLGGNQQRDPAFRPWQVVYIGPSPCRRAQTQ